MKINKSELMKTAWNIAKAAAVKFNDSAKAFFSEALKISWKSLKGNALVVNVVDALKKIGKEWKQGDHHRIYLNDLSKFIGNAEFTYKEKRNLSGCSAYYNVKNENWYVDDIANEYWDVIIAQIKRTAMI